MSQQQAWGIKEREMSSPFQEGKVFRGSTLESELRKGGGKSESGHKKELTANISLSHPYVLNAFSLHGGVRIGRGKKQLDTGGENKRGKAKERQRAGRAECKRIKGGGAVCPVSPAHGTFRCLGKEGKRK